MAFPLRSPFRLLMLFSTSMSDACRACPTIGIVSKIIARSRDGKILLHEPIRAKSLLVKVFYHKNLHKSRFQVFLGPFACVVEVIEYVTFVQYCDV